MLGNIFMFFCLIGISYLLFFTSKKASSPKTIQDLLSYKEIHPDGMIELDNMRYRMVLEFVPVNALLRSPAEKEQMWVTARHYLNSLKLPVSIIVQSRLLDIRNYLEDYERQALSLDEHLQAYTSRLVGHLAALATQKSIKDRRYYMVLKANVGDMEDAESSIEFDSDMANMLGNKAGISKLKKGKANEEEIRTAAYQELDNQATVIIGILRSAGLRIKKLEKIECEEMIHTTLNRDLSAVVQYKEMYKAGVFNTQMKTLTPALLGYEEEGERIEDIS